jgi:hypothetical protein
MSIGIPYAMAGVDDDGNYFVTCPECGETFTAALARSEDEATKDPVTIYGVHYEMRHNVR